MSKAYIVRSSNSEFISRPTPEGRVVKMNGLLRTLIDCDFENAPVLSDFIELYEAHTSALRSRSSGYSANDQIAFFERLDEAGIYFGEGTFDQIVFKHDEMHGFVFDLNGDLITS